VSRLFRRVLVPYDFSAPATRALETAADVVADGGRLLVLHVLVPFYPPREIVAWMPEPDLVPSARRRLETRVARALARRNVRVDCRVEVGAPVERILDAARRCDAIVMATAGRSGLPRVLIGSVAERVVRHASVPVLTLRPGARRARPRRTRR
jgi:nucleotide-binding universal stress UspA family protein